MIACICGQPVAARLGDGYVITLEERMRWMRRRSDILLCPACGRTWRLPEIERRTAEAVRPIG